MDMVRIRKKGTMAVEAAIVFPLLLLLTLGMIKYGWLFLKAQQITNAARQGARIAIRAGAAQTDVTDAIDALMAAAGMGATGYTVVVTWPDGLAWGDLELGMPVSVRVTVPCADIDVMDTGLLPAPANLAAEVTMAKEGF